MKIKLERQTKFCPGHLNCVVCYQVFKVERIRHLLYSDCGLLEGDLCADCMKLNSSTIQTKIKEQAWLLLQNQNLIKSDPIFTAKRASELLEMSKEAVKFPNVLQLWLKKIAILAEESSELEEARLSLTECYCQERQRLEHLFEESET
jgi:hypothetical protein